MEPKSMYSTNMIFVSGTICSGKSYLGKELADSFDYDFVEISRIVGGILSSNMRNDLQGHPELDVQIIDAIKDIRRSTRKDGLVSVVQDKLRYFTRFLVLKLFGWILL